ncbi:MAG: hypothetical protein HC880_03330 [Bacteroidia bacterium]|nr:hypothetical protein [Bacteroidia bacterium]
MVKSRSKRSWAEIVSLISAYEAGKETQAAFCARHQIGISTFNSWLKKHRQGKLASAEGGFARLEVLPPRPVCDLFMEIETPAGFRLRFYQVLSAGEIGALLEGLSR